MDRAVFKACLRDITGELPLNWKVLRNQYHESLKTAPVPDNISTAKEFIMNSFNLVMKTSPCNDVDEPPKKRGWAPPKVPATSLTVADVNRALDWLQDGNCVASKEGNNPMCNYNTPAKTETQIQRDYLTKRLDEVGYAKRADLQKTFHIHEPNQPQTYKELIDAIKNDKFEIDKKVAQRIDNIVENEGAYYGGSFEAIKWKLDNAPDYDGYHTAQDALEVEKTKVRDTIMAGVYADSLKAIQDLEAWQPTTKAN